MEGKKYYSLILFLWILISGIQANNQERIYQAYISGDMKTWKTVLSELKKNKPVQPELVLQRANIEYGYIGWCIGNKRWEEAELHLADLNQLLDVLENKKYRPAMVMAYRSAAIGFEIGLNKAKAPFVGPKSVRLAEKSMQTDPAEPLGFVQYGNSQYYMPAVFGGSKKEALGYYLKAMKLMENKPAELKNNWNYLSLLTQIAKAYYALGDNKTALNYLKKTLHIEPGYLWVKNELYPAYLKN